MTLKIKPQKNLANRMTALEEEFKEYLQDLQFKRQHREVAYSPLTELTQFAPQGLQAVAEVTREEMAKNPDALRKLLANMLHHCKPGALSSDDMEQLSGINGREVQSR